MRKCNTIITILMLVLFLLHVILGSLAMLRAINVAVYMYIIATLMALLILIHSIIGIILTIKTIVAIKKAGKHYFKENMLFWIRRISGFAVFIFMFNHMINFVIAFNHETFSIPILLIQILMVVSLIIHLVCNIKPLTIAMGLTDKESINTGIVFVLSVILLISAVAFLVFFLSLL